MMNVPTIPEQFLNRPRPAINALQSCVAMREELLYRANLNNSESPEHFAEQPPDLIVPTSLRQIMANRLTLPDEHANKLAMPV